LESTQEGVPTMDNSNTGNISVSERKILPVKKCWGIGPHIVTIIDSSIVNKLGINTDDICVEEQITSDGILLKIKRIGVDASE
jgi:hypothetical protein